MVKYLASKEGGSRTIVIEGAASPIGSDKYNNALALRRANVLRKILSEMEGGDKLIIHTTSAGEDWKAFESYIEANYQAENRREVLAILRMSVSNVQKERYIQALDAGKTWRVLVAKFMGSARNAVVVRIVESDMLLADSLRWAVRPAELIPPFCFERVVSEEEPIEFRKPVVALRSNLLVPALNFGVEVPIGTHWSVGADYYFPWVWPKRDNKNCFELLAWGIEGRYWFGRERTVFDRLQGHSLYDNGAILVLPQTVYKTTIKLHLEYIKQGDTEYAIRNIELGWLGSNTPTEWKSGEKYEYNLTITDNTITTEVKVVDWVDHYVDL